MDSPYINRELSLLEFHKRVLAQAQIGERTIDYTAAMSGGAIPSGFSLSFSGIQPVSRGLLVSDAVSAVE